ncbi:MAG: DciA family protein [Vicinamibacterales bacterium]
MIPVGRVIPDALVGLLRNAPLTPEKVAFAWRQAVGPSVDRVTTVELRESVLRVRAQDPQWQREVKRSAHLIRARLDSLLGDGIVKRIDIR